MVARRYWVSRAAGRGCQRVSIGGYRRVINQTDTMTYATLSLDIERRVALRQLSVRIDLAG